MFGQYESNNNLTSNRWRYRLVWCKDLHTRLHVCVHERLLLAMPTWNRTYHNCYNSPYYHFLHSVFQFVSLGVHNYYHHYH
jgi:hypothetical protein